PAWVPVRLRSTGWPCTRQVGRCTSTVPRSRRPPLPALSQSMMWVALPQRHSRTAHLVRQAIPPPPRLLRPPRPPLPRPPVVLLRQPRHPLPRRRLPLRLRLLPLTLRRQLTLRRHLHLLTLRQHHRPLLLLPRTSRTVARTMSPAPTRTAVRMMSPAAVPNRIVVRMMLWVASRTADRSTLLEVEMSIRVLVRRRTLTSVRCRARLTLARWRRTSR
ncbi:hypothetical protein F442_12980, partial [Phytophthora nicotianae P10297]